MDADRDMPERRAEVNPPTGGEFLSVATYLPIRRWLDVVPFFRMSSRINGQLMKSQVIRFAMKTDLAHKSFWTISVWPDVESMRGFVVAEPHASAMKEFAKWGTESAAFVEWTDGKGAIDWSEARERLKNPTRRFRRIE